MSLDDCIRKLFREELNTVLQDQHRSRLQSFSNSNEERRDCSHRRFTLRRRSHRGQSLLATSAAGSQTGHLLYVTDWESRLRFLVDTASEVSIIPPSKAEQKNRQDTFDLLATNNFPIMTYGTCSLMSNLGLR